jgi:hypothetical protein
MLVKAFELLYADAARPSGGTSFKRLQCVSREPKINAPAAGGFRCSDQWYRYSGDLLPAIDLPVDPQV